MFELQFVAGLSLTLKILFNCFQNNMLEGAVFMDCGTDLGSGRLVPGEFHSFPC